MKGCLKLIIYFVVFSVAVYILLPVFLVLLYVFGSGFAFYGVSLSIIGISLALTTPMYRTWLKSQKGYVARLSKLPGMKTDSPSVLAIATAVYLLPVSIFGWIILSATNVFSDIASALLSAVVGLFGILLIFGWFIWGWGVKSSKNKTSTNATSKAQEVAYFKQLKQLDEIKSLDPIAFEHFVGTLFERMGHTIQTTATTGDEGVDLILHKDTRLAVVQCKRYEGSVGQPVVRDLYGAMIHNRADEAYLVTTGTITLPAQQWATGKPIHLIDGNGLIDWVESFKEIEYLTPSTTQENKSVNQLTSAKIIDYFGSNTVSAMAILMSALLPVFICLSGLSISSYTTLPTATPTLIPTTISTEIVPTDTQTFTKPNTSKSP